MRTTLRLHKLEKATKIVELLQRAYNNAESARSDMHHFTHGNVRNPIRLFQTYEDISNRHIWWLTVAARLEQYYINTTKDLFVYEPEARA